MKLLKENEDFIYNFINNELKFFPCVSSEIPFLPFSINRPFSIYDISQINDSSTKSLREIMPSVLADCLPKGYQLYAIDWEHNVILYDPRNPQNTQSNDPCTPFFNTQGIAYYNDFYPDGDYYFFIDKYGSFGYLSHPWRQEVWVYGEPLVSKVREIHKQIGFILKSDVN